MKTKTSNKTSTAIVIFLASSFGSISTVSAAYSPTASAFLFAPEAKQSLATKRDILEEKHQQIEFEALAAVTGAQNALMALKKNDSKRAFVLLTDATKQLNLLLAKYPQSNLIPAIIDADILDFDSNTKQVEQLINAANDLLKDDRVQDARQLLDQLVSEVHVTTISVPLGSFSMGVKDAAYFASTGNVDKAEDVLYEVLNRLVKTREILPLPVLKAEGLLKEASKLEHTNIGAQEASRTEITKLFDAAKEKIKYAQMLGYGGKNDYLGLYDAIDDMKKVIFTKNSADAWNKITTTISGLKDKLTRLKK